MRESPPPRRPQIKFHYSSRIPEGFTQQIREQKVLHRSSLNPMSGQFVQGMGPNKCSIC